MSPDHIAHAYSGDSFTMQEPSLRRRQSAPHDEEQSIPHQAIPSSSRSLPPHTRPSNRGPDPFADPVAQESASRTIQDGTSAEIPPRRALSPLSHGTAPSQSSTTSSSSPSGGRNRGYSLRRALFSKGIGGASTPPEPIIELGVISPAPSHSHRPLDSKVSFDAQVEEVKATHGRDSPATALGTVSGRLPQYKTWLKDASRSTALSRAKGTFEKARKFILRIQDLPPSKDGRHIGVDATRKSPLIDERTNKPFINNLITSSRYTVYNFLPRQLIAQFSRIANFYFLLVSILQMIPGLSTTGTYTTIVPLLFFVSLSMAKEGYDDFRRHRLDKEENNRETTILHVYRPVESSEKIKISETSSQGPIHWATTKWKNVQVGDIVKLERDQAAPADLVVLHNRGENGVAYIETMALDGETNLKSKQATAALSRCCESMDKLASARPYIVVEDPNLDLYNFEGKVTVDDQTVPLTNLEVIYRGSILRNTPELVGLVVYSGEECKIRMNASKNARIKAPSLQNVVNKIVILICVFVILLSILLTVGYEIWENNELQRAWYLVGEDVSFGVIVVSFIIMFNTMIPLSLYVSLEIVKVFQMLLLNDIDMYDEATDTPMEARTSTINEELGQISYVFSDKTGTLTDNMMKFRKMSVAGTAWLHDYDIRKAMTESRHHDTQHSRSTGKAPVERGRLSTCDKPRKSGLSAYASPERDLSRQSHDSTWKSSARPNKAQPEMNTRELIRYIQRRPHTVFAKKARFFLLSITLCHTCLPETNEDGSISYQAASPDELALVSAAQEMGYIVIDKISGTLSIRELPATRHAAAIMEQYEILDVIEFSSKRKRMSVVVRFPDGRICVISKGADSVLMQLLRLAALAKQKNIEIEARATKRKDMEAHEAIARKSLADGPRPSFSGPSMHIVRGAQSSTSLPGNSITGAGRASISLSRKEPLRDQLDSWLSEREHDVDGVVPDDTSLHYEPRPSAQFTRPSMGTLDTRSSMEADENFELVEEALVIDEPAVIERCLQHINDFSTEGLRTLLYGYRFLNLEEYSSWKKIYSDATTSLLNRQSLIEAAGELIERDLELAGATAIEDKLQQGVPETIEKLRRANIKIWMLTGDKRETAINIGHSCRLIKDYSEVVVLDYHTGQLEQTIATAIVNMNRSSVAHSVVVIDGQTLSHIESHLALTNLFFSLAIIADSVICCRASPSQKAGLVKAIRHRVNKSITLAIGDGANDIAMIQEAHVGIGITGKEGLQAARTSDYSIAQFRFLAKLLLVHGRWNYVRTCRYVVATFWKELMFYLVQALYQHHTAYTGTSLYESWSLSVFNTLFTSLPVIFLGIFEKDLQASTLLAVPELYIPNQRNAAFNFGVYVWWMALAAVESVVIFFTMEGLYGSVKGESYTDAFTLGDMCYTAAVIIIACKLQLLTMRTISLANAIAIILSIGGWFVWNLLIAGIYSNNTEYDVKGGFTTRFGRSGAWWLTLIVGLAVVAVIEMAAETIRVAWFTSDEDVFRQLERDPDVKARFEHASRLELQAGWDAAERARKKGNHKRNKKGHVDEDDDADEEDERNDATREQDIEEILRKRPGPYQSDRSRSKHSQHRHQSRRSLEGRHSEAIDRKGTRMPGQSPAPPVPKGILKKSQSLGHITGMYEAEPGRWDEKAANGNGSGKKGGVVEVREV